MWNAHRVTFRRHSIQIATARETDLHPLLLPFAAIYLPLNTMRGSRSMPDSQKTSSQPLWFQKTISLSRRPRGFHLITKEIIRDIREIELIEVGLLHLFLQHTSAALSINENADPDVRVDMETVFNRIVPENQPLVHTLEGPDDMPAHVKSSLLGCSLTIPVTAGRLALGTWQGIYLCEHRNYATPRMIVLTLHGERRLT
jgi:secondary thiamine-phosphate synthase enzyme